MSIAKQAMDSLRELVYAHVDPESTNRRGVSGLHQVLGHVSQVMLYAAILGLIALRDEDGVLPSLVNDTSPDTLPETKDLH